MVEEKVTFKKPMPEHGINEGAVGELVSHNNAKKTAVVRVYGKTITVPVAGEGIVEIGRALRWTK